MHRYHLLWLSLFSIGWTSTVNAQGQATSNQTNITIDNPITVSDANLEQQATDTVDDTVKNATQPTIFQELKQLKAKDFKVNANAAQADEVKDPLQALNREIFKFNDMLDRNIVRPISVQYVTKVPEDVRSSYRLFRKNMSEPWNGVNQLAQGRPMRALKSFGRFTINTLTSLGLADPARRMGLTTEEESFGTTLGYYNVPSGPYLMLPILGPSSLRNSLDYFIEGYSRPINWAFMNNNQYGLELGYAMLNGIDTRSQYLDLESALQGDRYAAIRDIYLQRKSFEISEKQGNDAEPVSFIGDDEIDQEETN